jgi:AmmeMemoRadiSam system protein A
MISCRGRVDKKHTTGHAGFRLSREEMQELLTIARSSIEAVLDEKATRLTPPRSPVLQQCSGAFVTLEAGSRLRGCIGSMESDQPLFRTVSEMAVSSAFSDPRFPPLSRDELGRIRIEISVLSPLTKITTPEAIEVGVHGILLRKGPYSGVLLPQVAEKYDWTREEFLRQTCMKAGLPAGAWRESGCEIWIFGALVFGEDKDAD